MAVQISGAQVKSATLTSSNINFSSSQNWHFGSSQSLRWAGTASNDDDIVTKKDLDGVAEDICRAPAVALNQQVMLT